MSLFWLKHAAAMDVPRDHLKLFYREIESMIKRVPPETNEQYEMYVDETCDFIEESLAISFLICQRAITSIISEAMRIPDSQFSTKSKKLRGKQNLRDFLLNLKDEIPNEPAYSVAVCINAMANYYKHKSEWGHKLNKQQAETANIVTDLVGDSMNSTGVFRAAARRLGCGDNYDPRVLGTHLVNWHKNILKLLEGST